uniref:GNAT family N-acetyltransferase n=1 Tax=Agathobacter sp. TaxID=2021311 RepID=UPI004056DC29
MLFEYTTERLILKILTPESAADVLAFQTEDKELFELYEADRCPGFYTLEHHKKTLEYEFRLALKNINVRFYVFRKEDPSQIIGTVCLYEISSVYKRCELGYKFASRFHHHGYAYESLMKAIHIAFHELDIHRIGAHVQETNLPSIRLLKKIGFEQEGICRHHLCIKGQWTDHLQFSLFSDDLHI